MHASVPLSSLCCGILVVFFIREEAPHTLFGNRAAARLGLGRPQEALEDAEVGVGGHGRNCCKRHKAMGHIRTTFLTPAAQPNYFCCAPVDERIEGDRGRCTLSTHNKRTRLPLVRILSRKKCSIEALEPHRQESMCVCEGSLVCVSVHVHTYGYVRFVYSLLGVRPPCSLLTDGHSEGREVAQGLPPKGLRAPGNGRERGRPRNVPTRPRGRAQEQVRVYGWFGPRG